MTKRLNIIATSDDPADTHIVGEPDPESRYEGKTYGGRGTNAVRCVRFEAAAASDANAAPSILRGFTIRDGYCRQYANNIEGSDILAGQPGGVTSYSSAYQNFYVVDCVVSNCCGVRGGLMRFGNYVRCRFGNGSGSAGQNLGREVRMMGCLLAHPGASSLMSVTLVNTTIVDGNSRPFQEASAVNLYNTLMDLVAPPAVGAGKSGESCNSVLDFVPAGPTNETVVIAPGYQMVAPLRGDFRVRAGTVSATRGDAAHIAAVFPEAVDEPLIDIYRGLDGVSFAKSGPISVGCHARPVKTAGGAVQYDDLVLVDGYSGWRVGLYAFSEEPCGLLQVRPPDGQTFFRVSRGDGQGCIRYPEMDETMWEACPPEGIVVTNFVAWVADYMYVAPNGDDETGDGSAQKPYQTLAYCCTAARSGKNTLVYAAEGNYDKGGIVGAGMTNRIAFSGRRIRFKGAGRGKSFIIGQRSPSPGDADGRGPGAIRCAYLGSAWACIQGFTLKDGYADSGETSDACNQGGLVHISGTLSDANNICDCELIGGAAYRGNIVMNGSLTRCIVHGAKGYGGGACRETRIEDCVFYGNDFPTMSATVNANDCVINQSTFVANGYAHGTTAHIHNSVMMSVGSASNWSAMGDVSNTVYWADGGSYYAGAGDTCEKCDVRLADPQNGDCRPLATSPAVTRKFDVLPDYWKHPVTDVNGVPLRLTDGKVLCGAVQTPVMVVVANPPADGAFTSGAGTNVLEKGESVTVTFEGTRKRNAEDLLVNGEPVGGMSFTYTAGDPFAADGSVVPAKDVTVQFSTNWYVNAKTGDDFATGFTPETAWKSLTNVYTTGYVLAGDCVHAAAGDYTEGAVKMPTVGLCRAVVPSGVTLTADEGPASTRIVGARDDSVTDSWGRGANAVRCVYLNTKSKVVGFTLANGRVTDAGTTEGGSSCGAGIYATTRLYTDANCGCAENCVITNCAGGRGGAALYGKLVNCSIIDCVGTACTAAGYHSAHFGCHFTHCTRAGSGQLLRIADYVSHCTVGPDVSDGAIFNSMGTPGLVDNTVVLSKMSSDSGNKGIAFSNCVFRMTKTVFDGLAKQVGCVRIDAAADAGLDADCRPLRTSTLVLDKGVSTTCDAYQPATDAYGVQRTYNGARDIGAFEYDWRKDYAADLGGLAKVGKADPQVVETNGKVLVKDGEIALAFAPYSGRTAKYDIPLEVTGTGTLTVKAGDTAIATYTATDGARTLRVRDADTGSDYAFAYEPGDADEGGALIGKITGGVPGMLLLVR